MTSTELRRRLSTRNDLVFVAMSDCFARVSGVHRLDGKLYIRSDIFPPHPHGFLDANALAEKLPDTDDPVWLVAANGEESPLQHLHFTQGGIGFILRGAGVLEHPEDPSTEEARVLEHPEDSSTKAEVTAYANRVKYTLEHYRNALDDECGSFICVHDHARDTCKAVCANCGHACEKHIVLLDEDAIETIYEPNPPDDTCICTVADCDCRRFIHQLKEPTMPDTSTTAEPTSTPETPKAPTPCPTVTCVSFLDGRADEYLHCELPEGHASTIHKVTVHKPKRPTLYYLASPYSSDDPAIEDQRAKAAIDTFLAMIDMGLLVYSPIAAMHAIRRERALPGDWQTWAALDKRMIDACDVVIVLCLDGWDESVGVQAEIEYAAEKRKPFYRVGDAAFASMCSVESQIRALIEMIEKTDAV